MLRTDYSMVFGVVVLHHGVTLSSLLICRSKKDKRLSWPVWLTCSGWFTTIIVATHQLQVEHGTGKVHSPETDVLPLCNATNLCGRFYDKQSTSM